MPKQIPVYLFVGQLESGKTKFIQETMEDPNFDSGDKTLLLVCEEGEIEYDPSKFAFGGVHVAQIEDKSELTAENLTALEKKSGCGRVIIEYNGMWLIQELYDALPDNWLVYQSLATADGTTIKTYAGDSAMRSLLLDKLRGSELLVVNRAGKNSFVPGRFAMTCCVQDIQFVGFPCSYDGYKALEQRSWVRVTAKVSYKFHNIYRGKGPVLTAISVEPAEKPLNEVVTFS